MFRNYFITSVRSLALSKGFSAINIIGLSVGLATFSLIAFYVYHELSFDHYHKNGDRIFRIVSYFSPILILVFWELASRSGLVDRRFFPPPTAIAWPWRLSTSPISPR